MQEPLPASEPVKLSALASPPRRPVAVIDIGSSAIRMEIAELDDLGNVHSLEALQHPVNLGKDTFTAGRIDRETTEECVQVLRGFRRILQEYGITDKNQIRAVATSSVREATNRDSFLNRIYIAAHIPVEAIDEAEVNRLTYIAVRYNLEKQNILGTSDTLIVEVGGGSTELLLLQAGHVSHSHTYRLGSLRMRETLETSRTPVNRFGSILGQHIQRTIDQIRRTIPVPEIPRMIAIGGDARFAARELGSGDESERIVGIDSKKLSRLSRQVLALSVDDLVRKYRLTYQEAETIGPALLAYVRMAESFKVKELLISQITLRDGLLLEMATQGTWTEHFREQVIHSAKMLGRKYQHEEKHAYHVAELSRKLFIELQSEHGLDQRFELLLYIAALLHEIGLFVANRSHHKHSMYLIQNSDLFGLSQFDTLLVALVARYHRRATPSPAHEGYMTLDLNHRLTVSKLAAILRVADALDQNHVQQIRDVTFSREEGRFVIHTRGVQDLTLERLAVRQKGALFEEIFGMQVELRKDPSRKGV